MPAVHRVRAHLYRVKLETPVVLSFGKMLARWALLVSVEDKNGRTGWGEVWCNFPDCGASHRYHLLRQLFAPILEGVQFEHPSEVFRLLNAQTQILKIQTAETGPIDQCIAGLDCAIWDLFARHEGKPLYALLGGSRSQVKTYASGINPRNVSATIENAKRQGHCRFKVKVGFGLQADLETLTQARESAGALELACDANQAWDTHAAIEHINAFKHFNLSWVEEPIRADHGIQEWQFIARDTTTRIAAGENLNSLERFEHMVSESGIGIIQPDLAKWGGITGTRQVAKLASQFGVPYYPHYLGAAVGLIASAHLLAATNPDGLLEVDVNENPLRTTLLEGAFSFEGGAMMLNDEPGLGFTPDLSAIQQYQTESNLD
jgi:D-galactarolactone cycloisomerase